MHATTCAAPIHLDADMPAVQLEAVHEPTCMRIGTTMSFFFFGYSNLVHLNICTQEGVWSLCSERQG